MTARELFQKYLELDAREKLRFDNHLKRENELEKLENLGKRLEIAKELNNLKTDDGEPFFEVDFLMRKIMKYSDEEITKSKKEFIVDKFEPIEIKYIDKSYDEKRRILRKFAYENKEANTILIILNKKIKESLSNYSKEKIELFIDDIKDLLTDGYLAYEKIYEKDIVIDCIKLDPTTLTPSIDPGTNKTMWIQYINDNSRRKILNNEQIVYINGTPSTALTSVIEGVYLNILDFTNNIVVDEISNIIVESIKKSIK